MKNIAENLYIGSMQDTQKLGAEWAVAHVCKTAHKAKLGYRRSLSPKHPHYVILEADNHLYVNWVDTHDPKYFDWPRGAGVDNFNRVLDFVAAWSKRGPVLIHCDKGLSRSPTVGLLYLAKRLGVLPASDYASAKAGFLEVYPAYAPGNGIMGFVSENWACLG